MSPYLGQIQCVMNDKIVKLYTCLLTLKLNVVYVNFAVSLLLFFYIGYLITDM